MADTRVHKARLEIEHWCGSIGEVAQLLTVAKEILARTQAEPSGIWSEVDVRYEDGSESFASVEQFTDARAHIEVHKVESIQTFMRADNDHGIHFHLGGYPGLRLSASSSDRVWAFGAVDVLSEIALRGRQPAYSRRFRTLTWWEWVAVGGGALAFVAAVVAALLYRIPASSVVLLAGSAVVVASMPVAGNFRLANPAVTLLHDDPPRRAHDESRISPARKAQEIVRRQPLLSLSLTFVFGVLINKVSEWI